MSILPGTVCTSSGLVTPFSIAPAAVIIFATEPGSNGAEIVLLPNSFPCSSCFLISPIGSIESLVAMAITCAVFASSTTADALFAPEFAFACSNCCCTYVCRSKSRVSVTFAPFVAGTSSVTVPGIACPSVDTSIDFRPLIPDSNESFADSNPNWPCPSWLILPITFDATAPLGYWRTSCKSAAIP